MSSLRHTILNESPIAGRSVMLEQQNFAPSATFIVVESVDGQRTRQKYHGSLQKALNDYDERIAVILQGVRWVG